MTVSLIDHFSELDDPRIERNKAHALLDIIVLTVSAAKGSVWVRRTGSR